MIFRQPVQQVDIPRIQLGLERIVFCKGIKLVSKLQIRHFYGSFVGQVGIGNAFEEVTAPADHERYVIPLQAETDLGGKLIH